jgi:catechol 2,3-dioxygenase-like lactoylglutathione lyase family enzyme
MITQQPTTSVINGIDVTMYLVKDMERAISFYRDTLGLAVTKSFGPAYSEFTLSDGTTFGLFKQETWFY